MTNDSTTCSAFLAATNYMWVMGRILGIARSLSTRIYFRVVTTGFQTSCAIRTGLDNFANDARLVVLNAVPMKS